MKPRIVALIFVCRFAYVRFHGYIKPLDTRTDRSRRVVNDKLCYFLNTRRYSRERNQPGFSVETPPPADNLVETTRSSRPNE